MLGTCPRLLEAKLGKRGGAKDELMQVHQTDDGLHLANSILWFDSEKMGELSFLSSAISVQHPRVPQVIATEETIKILETHRRRPNALVCQYNRPFSIGRLKMELLPSGCVLGGASLYVEIDKGRLLYAPQVQTNRVPTVRQMQLKKAHTLVLGAFYPDLGTPLPNRRKEKERLLDTISRYISLGKYPVIFCDPVSIAQELTKTLSDEGIAVAVHDAVFKIHKVYESFGSKLGQYTRLSRRHTKQKVILLPLPSRRPYISAAGFGGAPIISVEPTLEAPPHDDPVQIDERFVLSTSCDGPEIKEIVSLVGPKELYVFGPYAKRYVEGLSGIAPSVRAIFANDQPTLF